MKIKIELPEELTLEQYKSYLMLVDGLTEDGIKERSNAFVKAKLISIVVGLSIEEVNQIEAKDIDKLFKSCIDIVADAINEGSKLDATPTFTYKDVRFGRIPSLEQMTAGEYIDLSEYFGKTEYLERFAAVMLRPVDKVLKNTSIGRGQYSLKKYNGTEEMADVMRGIPAKHIIAASFFLERLLVQLATIIISSSESLEAMTEEKVEVLKTLLLASGDGIKRYMLSLESLSLI